MGVLYDIIVVCAVSVVFIFVVIPILLYSAPGIVHRMFFLNFVKYPFTDYRNLSAHGVNTQGRNFYLQKPLFVDQPKGKSTFPKLGIWHVLPASVSQTLENQAHDQIDFEKVLNEGSESIVLYFHGNSFDRTGAHRCSLYNFLTSMNFHVFSLDYRGYGDSTGTPTEDGVVEDAHTVYEYVKSVAPHKDIFVWGHSMGTGVSSRLVAELSDAGDAPAALILESPFNNLRDVIRGHPLSRPLLVLPWFDRFIVEPLEEYGLKMNSDQHIKRVSCPILIFHAMDDHIISVDLARKLYESAKEADRKVELVEFEPDRAFQHKFIHRAEELPDLLGKFIADNFVQKRSRNRVPREIVDEL